MNMNQAHIEAFSESDGTIQPDVYIMYDAENEVTIFYEDSEIVLDLGYND